MKRRKYAVTQSNIPVNNVFPNDNKRYKMVDNNAEQLPLDDLSEISAGTEDFKKNALESGANPQLINAAVGIREGGIKTQIAEIFRSRLPNMKHQFKSLCAFGGVAPNLIIQDGQFSPAGLAEDIGETAAIAVLGEVPIAGPIISGALSVYFSSLQSDRSADHDNALLKQISKMINTKSSVTLSRHDSLVTQAEFSNITTKSIDYHNNLSNYCGFEKFYDMDLNEFKTYLNGGTSSQPLITINEAQVQALQDQVRQLETMVFGLTTHIRSSVDDANADDIIYLSAYRNLGLFATGCAMQISSYIALIDILEYCIKKKSKFGYQDHYKIVSDAAQQFIVDSHNKMIMIAVNLAQEGNFKWNKGHPGLSVFAQKGGDMFTTMARLFLARYKGLYCGQRQSAELFTMLSRSDADGSNLIFSGQQPAWLERNAPPTSVRGVYHKAFIDRLTFSYQPFSYNDVQVKTAKDCASFNYKLEIPGETMQVTSSQGGAVAKQRLTTPPSYIAASSKFSLLSEAVEHYSFTVLDTGCCHLSLSNNTTLFDIGEYGRFTSASRPDGWKILWDTIIRSGYTVVNNDVKANHIVNFTNAADKTIASYTFNGTDVYFMAGSVNINGISKTQYPQDNTFALIVRNVNSKNNISHVVTNLAFKKRLLEFDACCGFTYIGQEKSFLKEYHHSDPFIGRKVIGIDAGSSLTFLPHQLHKRDINREWDIFLVIGFYNIATYPDFSVKIYDSENHKLRSNINCNSCSENILTFNGIFIHKDDMNNEGSNINPTQFIIYRSESTVTLPANMFNAEIVCNDKQVKYLVASLCFSRDLDELDKEEALKTSLLNHIASVSPVASFSFTVGEE